MTPQAQSVIAASGEVFPMEPVFQARRDAAPTFSDQCAAAYEIAKLKTELEKAYEGFARERGRAKIVAPTFREFIDAWIALMPAAEQGIEAQNAWADRRAKAMKDAVAVLGEIEQ